MYADYHIHSNFSPDGYDSMEAICRHAIRIGLDEIAMTDHFELYSPDFPDPNSYFQASLLDDCEAEARRVQDRFAGRLRVVLGIEMGQPHEDFEAGFCHIARYRNRTPIFCPI